MLTVLLVDSEQEKGQHQANHQHRRRVIADTAPREKVDRDARQTARAETNQLAGSQTEHDLVFDFRQILGNWHKWHGVTVSPGNLPNLPAILLSSLLYGTVTADSCDGYKTASLAWGLAAFAGRAGKPAASCLRMDGLRSSASSAHFSRTRALKSARALSRSSW